MTDVIAIRRALVSVWDKAGLAGLADVLDAAGVAIVSTGSTARAVRAAGVAVTEVADVTGFPEILDGRVKTLHPGVHAGILADRSKPSHAEALDRHGIEPVDLVVVNLYPFRETVAARDIEPAKAIEMIDVGGPAMVRAAAKNHASVAVVVDPGDYGLLTDELRRLGGVSAATRRSLAAKAFAHTAAYDTQVAAWFAREEPFADFAGAAWRKKVDLRYGENPHQRAAFYVEVGDAWGLGSAVRRHGPELSYNNLLDADAAWAAVTDFEQPCVAIIKHINPAGLAVGRTLPQAYRAALEGDPVSAYGGIVAVNRPLDAATARLITGVFTEVVVAPSYDPEALAVLRDKPRVRVLEICRPAPPGAAHSLRSVAGGLLVSDPDTAPEDETSWTVPTVEKPDEALMSELRFAWRACKHARSNAIVLARNGAVVGVGAGQMSRVDSVRLAVDKAGGRSAGAVLASDAFFPFRDGLDAALEAGVVGIIQPGGSKRDAEAVDACEQRGVPMVFTGRRHFRH